MKKRIMAVLLAFCMVVPAFAKVTRIDMRKGTKHPIKRSMDIVPVHAFIDDCTKELSLEFMTDWGTVYVTVSDINGNIVYTDVIDAASNVPYFISLDKDLKGEFTLSIANDKNEVSGEFFINN